MVHIPARALLVTLLVPATVAWAHPVSHFEEAEFCPSGPWGRPVPDDAASNGEAWLLDQNGKAWTVWNAEHDGTYRVAVRARGTPLAGEHPFMSAFVDDRAVGHWEVTGDYARYVTDVVVEEGYHELRIGFWNSDAHCAEHRRRLFVDYLDVLLVGAGDPAPFWQEAEDFPEAGVGGSFADVSASMGHAWNLWSNGDIATSVPIASYQTVVVDVWARADVAGGVGANMTLRVDGAVVERWEVRNTRLWERYSAEVTLFEGEHRLSIGFDNNVNDPVLGDRNLRVDAVSVAETTADAPEGRAIRFEVDEFPTTSPDGFWREDPAASAGGHWFQPEAGGASMTYDPPASGEATFELRARGSPGAGEWPRVALRIDGATVAEWSVESDVYGTYSTVAELADATQDVALVFVNDGGAGADARSVVLDRLDVTPPVVPLPPWSPEPGASEWTMPGFDAAGSRHNRHESGIGAGNVADLELAWAFPTARAISGSPVVSDGVAYVADWGGDVHAIDVATGDAVWSVALGHAGVTNSPLLADGRLFVGTRWGEMVALDAASGAHLWTTPLDAYNLSHVWGSPVHHEGKLYVGTGTDQMEAGYWEEPDFRGAVVRLDAASGVIEWRHENVPAGRTGAAVWTTPALDTGTMTLYFATSNAYTEPAHAHTDAILAVDAESGALEWAYQAVEGDVWSTENPVGPDSDFGMSTLVWRGGDGRMLVGAGNKEGDFFALDGTTGDIEWSDGMGRKVGFFGPGGHAYGRHYATLARDQRLVSFDPADGAFYWGVTLTDRSMVGVVVANGLVFTGATDGSVYAVDAGTGDVLWRGQVPDAGVWGPLTVAEGTVFVPYAIGGYVHGDGGVAAFRAPGSSVTGHAPAVIDATISPSTDRDVTDAGSEDDVGPGGSPRAGGAGLRDRALPAPPWVAAALVAAAAAVLTSASCGARRRP